MSKPTLVVMAAGMGSRYGGLKQIDPVGPSGEIIMDYSIYDAVKAGFGKVVFVIKKELEQNFREVIGKRIEKYIETDYVFQELRDIPGGFCIPAGRVKPWGTGHAVYSCRHAVDTPFAVINADDFYGSSSYVIMAQFLSRNNNNRGKYAFGMIGFHLENTLTEHGHVARGICSVNREGFLQSIKERTRIERSGESVKYMEEDGSWTSIEGKSIVSMNLWGFTPEIFTELEAGFSRFLIKNSENILNAEYFLPEAVGYLVDSGRAGVKVFTTPERWYGVTYREDRELVRSSIGKLIKQGFYPENLWRQKDDEI